MARLVLYFWRWLSCNKFPIELDHRVFEGRLFFTVGISISALLIGFVLLCIFSLGPK